MPASRIQIVSPCIDQRLIHIPSKDEQESVAKQFDLWGKPLILTTGRLVRRKGHEVTIKALPQLLALFPDIQYCIAGDGQYRERLEQIARSSGVEKQVRFTSAVSQKTLDALYELADIYVFTPTHDEKETDVEGFGIVYHEAMAHKKAVIASRSGGAAEAVAPAGGIIIPYESVKDLVRSVEFLWLNPVKRNEIAEKGYQYVSSRNWDQELLPLYKLLHTRL